MVDELTKELRINHPTEKQRRNAMDTTHENDVQPISNQINKSDAHSFPSSMHIPFDMQSIFNKS
jgi:hypothetical protein